MATPRDRARRARLGLLTLLATAGCTGGPDAGASGTEGASGATGVGPSGDATGGTPQDEDTSGTWAAPDSGEDSTSASEGVDTTGGADGDGTTTRDDDGTTTGEVDVPVEAAPPDWLLPIDGVFTNPILALPLADGALGVFVGSAPVDADLVFAPGGVDETVVPMAQFEAAPVMATVDPDTGLVESAVPLSQRPPGAEYGSVARLDGATVADNGDLILMMSASGGFTRWLDLLGSSYATLSPFMGEAPSFGRDTLVTRLAPSGEFLSFTTIRAPDFFEPTFPTGIATLPGGDAIVAGSADYGVLLGGSSDYEVAGDTYVARVDATGAPVWLRSNLGVTSTYTSTVATSDVLYAALPGDGVVFVGTPFETTLQPEEEMYSEAIGRIGLDGSLEWTVQFDFTDAPAVGPLTLSIGAAGTLFVTGWGAGPHTILDAAGATTSVNWATPTAFVASFDTEGSLQSLTELGTAFPPPLPIEGDGIWYLVSVAAPFELATNGATLTLPDLGAGAQDVLNVAVSLDADGALTEAQVVGANFGASALPDVRWATADQDGWYIAQRDDCEPSPESPIPYVVDSQGTGLVPVPGDCNGPDSARRGFVTRIPRAASP